MEFDLQGQTVLITGATGGIGQACVHAFAGQGANVILHCHSRRDLAQALVDSIDSPAMFVQANIREEDEVSRMFQESLATFPQIDVLVVNAGVWVEKPVPLHEMTLEQWHETIDTDLTGAFLCCREFLRHVDSARRESASIVLVGSTAALFGEADHCDYASAKAGLVYGMTRSLKNEIARLAPCGRVNAVCPGWTRTPMTEAGLGDPQLVAHVESTMALQKLATAEDVAAAVLFFASDRMSGHITGSILPIAGGMEGRLLHPPTGEAPADS